MKAILIILFSCATAINYAQGYQSIIGDSLTKWNIATGYCDEAQTDSFFVIGDTMINLNEYKIIAKNSFVDTIGFIHEDTINGKAWFLNKKKQKEYLFYDLSLHEGDTFNLIEFE